MLVELALSFALARDPGVGADVCAREVLSVARVEDLSIAYRDLGPAGGRPVLLIAGTDQQLTQWPGALLAGLAAEGFRPIIYDARDVGCSTHHVEAGPVDWAGVFSALAAGQPPALAYDLNQLAADAAALLDELGIPRADVVGVSGGATVAGELAASHPDRIGRLVLVMANSGNPERSMPADPARMATLSAMPPMDAKQEDVVAYRAAAWALLEGEAGLMTAEERRAAAQAAAARSWDPDGLGRSGAALLAAGDRREPLAQVQAPTVVIHGEADPLISIEAGRDVAGAIPGARFVVIPGMGHGLTAEAIQAILGALSAPRPAHD